MFKSLSLLVFLSILSTSVFANKLCYIPPVEREDGTELNPTGAIYDIYRIESGILHFVGQTTEVCYDDPVVGYYGYVVRTILPSQQFSKTTEIIYPTPASLDGTSVTELSNPNPPSDGVVTP